MKALHFESELSLINIDRPVPSDGESLIRTVTTGICNTDIEITRGYMGFAGVPGHEFVGIVEESASAGFIGKRVVGEINAGCGVCDLCKSGDSRHCPERTILGIFGRNGTFAEYFTLPDKNLFELPEKLPKEAAVFTEPLAAALQIFDEHEIDDKEIAVIGSGKLGLLIILAAVSRGYNPVVFGRSIEKLNIAEAWGAQPADGNGSRKFPTVIECSGNQDGLEKALEIIRPKGRIFLKSTYSQIPEIDTSRIVVDEISVIGSRCGRFAPALELAVEKQEELTSLIAGRFKIDEGIEAFRSATEPGALKIILEVSES